MRPPFPPLPRPIQRLISVAALHCDPSTVCSQCSAVTAIDRNGCSFFGDQHLQPLPTWRACRGQIFVSCRRELIWPRKQRRVPSAPKERPPFQPRAACLDGIAAEAQRRAGEHPLGAVTQSRTGAVCTPPAAPWTLPLPVFPLPLPRLQLPLPFGIAPMRGPRRAHHLLPGLTCLRRPDAPCPLPSKRSRLVPWPSSRST